MDLLKGKFLINKNDEKLAADGLLQMKSLVLYYFTSIKCEPCRTFDVKLKEVYKEAITRKTEMAVIVVANDEDMESMMTNMKTNYAEWFAVPFRDDLVETLKYSYGVTHIPNVVVVRKNGAIVTREGRSEIENIGKNVLISWTE